MKAHLLKTINPYFRDVMNHYKDFEIREDDREFEIRDLVILAEWDGSKFTGLYVLVKIKYICEYNQKQGYVVFGFGRLSEDFKELVNPFVKLLLEIAE